MAQNTGVSIEMPVLARQIRLPKGVDDRLKALLDRQDSGQILSAAEKREAEGLVELAEMLTLMRLRTERASRSKEK